MSDECEFLSKCGFFQNFSGNSETVKEGWIKIFCKDKDKSETCKRSQIRRETGIAPPDNMTPTGKLLV
ncbi:MAG: hypothetical protein JW936_06600 [Sedimentisphaerales bacterium]|nr:hypothetical protein [Sedimentisphaerales bacterium]